MIFEIVDIWNISFFLLLLLLSSVLLYYIRFFSFFFLNIFWYICAACCLIVRNDRVCYCIVHLMSFDSFRAGFFFVLFVRSLPLLFRVKMKQSNIKKQTNNVCMRMCVNLKSSNVCAMTIAKLLLLLFLFLSYPSIVVHSLASLSVSLSLVFCFWFVVVVVVA